MSSLKTMIKKHGSSFSQCPSYIVQSYKLQGPPEPFEISDVEKRHMVTTIAHISHYHHYWRKCTFFLASELYIIENNMRCCTKIDKYEVWSQPSNSHFFLVKMLTFEDFFYCRNFWFNGQSQLLLQQSVYLQTATDRVRLFCSWQKLF